MNTSKTCGPRSLAWAAAVSALVMALGYATHRWAGTGSRPALEPLPGSPWPYLSAWAVFAFGAVLLVRRSAHLLRWDVEAFASLPLAVPLVVGVNITLAHRPDPVLLHGCGLLLLAVAAGAVLLWCPRRSGRP